MASPVLVQTALAPRLAVYSTSEVNDLISSTIALPNLSTLLAPWSDSVEKVTLRSHTYDSSVTAQRFPLRIDEAIHVRDVGPWETQGGWLDESGQEIQQRANQWLQETSSPTGEYLDEEP